MHIGMKDGTPFGMAGLFERWLNVDGEILNSCTIVTTDANDLLRPIHDRMPVIVAPAQYARWLDPEHADVTDLIAPYPSAAMACYPVSNRVNNVRHDDAALIESVTPQAPASAPHHEPPSPEQESLF
jgi:putative SOS response-associated peptidase YedK